MKKVILSILAIVFALTNAHGQRVLRYGVEAGADFSKQTKYTRSTKTGFNVGFVIEYDVISPEQGIFFSSGLGLVSKPWESETLNFIMDDKTVYTISEDATPYYLRLPVRFGYRYALAEKWSISASTGLYIGVGLFGKSNQYETILSPKPEENNSFDVRDFSNKIDCFGGNGIYKQFDWGWTSSVGLQYARNWQLNVNVDYQFNSSLKGNLKTRNLTIGVGIAYLF